MLDPTFHVLNECIEKFAVIRSSLELRIEAYIIVCIPGLLV